jgi:hypothetical protein
MPRLCDISEGSCRIGTVERSLKTDLNVLVLSAETYRRGFPRRVAGEEAVRCGFAPRLVRCAVVSLQSTRRL